MLWEEMRGQEPKVDAVYVQERVLLRQEVRPLVSPPLCGQGTSPALVPQAGDQRDGRGEPPPNTRALAPQ